MTSWEIWQDHQYGTISFPAKREPLQALLVVLHPLFMCQDPAVQPFSINLVLPADHCSVGWRLPTGISSGHCGPLDHLPGQVVSLHEQGRWCSGVQNPGCLLLLLCWWGEGSGFLAGRGGPAAGTAAHGRAPRCWPQPSTSLQRGSTG